MSLNIDILFYKLNGSIQKTVCITAATQCDQGMNETLGLTDLVLGEFKKECSYVINIYGKLDNAGSYHGNFGAETWCNICKSKGVNLVLYDFIDPCCGTDQCDQESDVAKYLIYSFVDAGNDVMSASDIFKALQFTKGVKSTKVGVVEVDSSKSILQGNKGDFRFGGQWYTDFGTSNLGAQIRWAWE